MCRKKTTIDVPFSVMASPKRIRCPLTFNREADRKADAVTEAMFDSFLSSTVQGDVVPSAVSVVVEEVAQHWVDRVVNNIDWECCCETGANASAVGAKASNPADATAMIAAAAADAVNLMVLVLI